MAEGIEGNGYVEQAPGETSPLAPPAADPGPDFIAIVHGAERAAVRRFSYPFVRLVADEA